MEAVIRMKAGIHLRVTAFVGVVVLLLAALSCGDVGTERPNPDVVVVITSPTEKPTPRPRRTLTPSPTPSPSPLQVCAPNPDPASPKVLQVLEPRPEQQVKIPFHVRGWGSNIGYENRGVALAVVDAKQSVQQVIDLPPQPRTYRVAPPALEITDFTRPFGADIVIPNIKEPTPFCLWIYQETTETGRPKGVVQVPVLVLP